MRELFTVNSVENSPHNKKGINKILDAIFTLTIFTISRKVVFSFSPIFTKIGTT